MSESGSAPLTVTLTRVFDAPVELVYRAWTMPEHVTRWMKCDVEATLDLENWVPAVGTEFRSHMRQPGAFDTRITGRFTEVDPPHVLAYETDPHPEVGVPGLRVRVVFEDLGHNRTAMTLAHSGIPGDRIFGIIRGGWTASLAQLDTVVRVLRSPPPG